MALSGITVFSADTNLNQDMMSKLNSTTALLGLKDLRGYPNLCATSSFDVASGISGLVPKSAFLTKEMINQQNPTVTSIMFLPPSLLKTCNIPSIQNFLQANVKEGKNFSKIDFKSTSDLIIGHLTEKLKVSDKNAPISSKTGPQLLFAPVNVQASLKTLSSEGITKKFVKNENHRIGKDTHHWEASLGTKGSITVSEINGNIKSVLANLHSDANTSQELHQPSSVKQNIDDGYSISSSLKPNTDDCTHVDNEKCLAVTVTSNLTNLNGEYQQFLKNAIKVDPSITVNDMLQNSYHKGVIQMNVRNNARLFRQVLEAMGIQDSFGWKPDTLSHYHEHPQFTAPLLPLDRNIHHTQISNISTPSASNNLMGIHYNDVAFNPLSLKQPSLSGVMMDDHKTPAKTIGTIVSPTGDRVLWQPKEDEHYGIQGPISLIPAELGRAKNTIQNNLSTIETNFRQMAKLTQSNPNPIVMKCLFMYEIPSRKQ